MDIKMLSQTAKQMVASGKGIIVAIRENPDAGKARDKLGALRGVRLYDSHVSGRASARQHPADERGCHVAATDEGCRHCGPFHHEGRWLGNLCMSRARLRRGVFGIAPPEGVRQHARPRRRGLRRLRGRIPRLAHRARTGPLLRAAPAYTRREAKPMADHPLASLATKQTARKAPSLRSFAN